MKILHFADAHIDMAGQGRRDPQTGLPVRVTDFLAALDAIVDAAVNERVDLVIFAGDAYRDRAPAPTFQREWGKRIMRLSRAGIPTLLLVGNHDLSPALGRAHALQEYETLDVPHIRAVGGPKFFRAGELDGLPLQVIALPWVTRSSVMAAMQSAGMEGTDVNEHIENGLHSLLQGWLGQADPGVPVVLTAHASVQGAKLGGERTIMLGNDLALAPSMVRDPRLAYVALGHIHKPQNLNEGAQPPVVYPGSIERVDFGEVDDDKYFVIAHVQPGEDTRVEWRKLNGRRFVDRKLTLTLDSTMQDVFSALPAPEEIRGAMLRLTLEYPRAWESRLDEAEIRRRCGDAFEFHLLRRPQEEARLRLPEGHAISSLSPLEQLDVYWKTITTSRNTSENDALRALAGEVIRAVNGHGETGG